MKDKRAFPYVAEWYDAGKAGMTLREYYAGLAMQGLISDIKFDEEYSARELAIDAVSLADALIEELSK